MSNLTNFAVLNDLTSMDIAKNIKKLREERNLMQKEIANTVGVHPSNYSKMEKGEREFSIEVIDKLAKFFGLTIDELVYDNKLPEAVKLEDKTATEKIQLISMLNEDDKNAVYRIIDSMLTKTKFQTFFEQNIVTN
jgi:transcriptional regulator with XRE-family HTH domain